MQTANQDLVSKQQQTQSKLDDLSSERDELTLQKE